MESKGLIHHFSILTDISTPLRSAQYDDFGHLNYSTIFQFKTQLFHDITIQQLNYSNVTKAVSKPSDFALTTHLFPVNLTLIIALPL